jgi:hypothetical protein
LITFNKYKTMSTFINLYLNQIKKLQEELSFILEENKILKRTLKEDIIPGTPYDPRGDDDGDGIPNWQDRDDDGDGIPDVFDPDHPDYIDPADRVRRTFPKPDIFDDGLPFGGFNGNWMFNQDFMNYLRENFPEWFERQMNDWLGDFIDWWGGDIDGDGIPNYLDDDIDGDGIPNEKDDRPAYPSRGNIPTAGKYTLPGTTPVDGWRDPVTGIYWSGWYGGHSPDHPRWRPPEPPPGGGGGQGGGGFGSGGGFYTGGGKDEDNK